MTKRFLKPKDVAELLQLNVLTVYEYIRDGRLKSMEFGGRYRIEENDLEKFIKEHKVKN
jgi:excisionase family DNA binding protein